MSHMRDPLLIDANDQPLPDQRIPDHWRAKYLDRDVKKLPNDVIHAFDYIHELRKQRRKDKDVIIAELLSTRKRLRRANLKIWIMSLIVSPVIAELVHFAKNWLLQHAR